MNVTVFLSSTFLDLRDARRRIAEWLSGVFGVELEVMETFGSDAAPPDVAAVRRVRNADVFVGVYGRRYGTIEPVSGKSITELELDEASFMLSSGTLLQMLLYIIRDESEWLREFAENSDEAKAGLRRLREKARQHACASFSSQDELLFVVLRDMYRTLGVAHVVQTPALRQVAIPPPAKLRSPTGMEFLGSSDRDYLVGREQSVSELVRLSDDEPIVLLLGDSGIGKTSLIHAGLVPRAKGDARRVIYTRPYKLPASDIAQQVLADVFLHRVGHPSALVPLLGEVSAALDPQHVVVVIDQFEDVLAMTHEQEVHSLLAALSTVRNLRPANRSVIISYRADLEGRVGVYWQQVSGSPAGLPRVYVGGLSVAAAWGAAERAAADLGVELRLTPEQQALIRADLLAASAQLGVDGVYPPYIQMLIDAIWSSCDRGHGPFTHQHYLDCGGIDGVIGGYLARQLTYAQDSTGNVRRVLVSLVKSYGVKAQRSLDEVASDIGLAQQACEAALERLIDLRLVRHVEGAYEIAHDFLARKVANELIDSTERQFKRSRELLASKAAAFQTTRTKLSSEELIMLYRHRDRIVPSESESRLLLASWLSTQGPGLCWLLPLGGSTLLQWLNEEFNSAGFDPAESISASLLSTYLGSAMWSGVTSGVLRDFARSSELAMALVRRPEDVPANLALRGLTVPTEVREACEEAIVSKMIRGDWSLLIPLRRSRSPALRAAYEDLVLRSDVPSPSAERASPRDVTEFALLKRIAAATCPSRQNAAPCENSAVPRADELPRLERRAALLVRSLAELHAKGVRYVLKRMARRSVQDVRIMLRGIRMGIKTQEVVRLIEHYRSLPVVPDAEAASAKKEVALGDALARCLSSEHHHSVRELLLSRPLTSAVRPLLIWFLANCSTEDVVLILDAGLRTPHALNMQNQVEIATVLGSRMAMLGGRVPSLLSELAGKREFWEYVRISGQRYKKDELLPLANPENRRFIVRLAGHALIGLYTSRDDASLIRLALHEYRSVSRAAGTRLWTLFGQQGLTRLSEIAEDAISAGASQRLAESLRFAELGALGVM